MHQSHRFIVYVGNSPHDEFKTLSSARRKANKLQAETSLVVRVVDAQTETEV